MQPAYVTKLLKIERTCLLTIFRVSNYGGTKIGNITQRLLVSQVIISLTTRKFNYPKLFMVSNVYNIMDRSN